MNRQKEKLQTVSKQDTIVEYQTKSKLELLSQRVNEIGFIERGTGKHQSNIVYGSNGICPCEYAGQYKEPFKVLE